MNKEISRFILENNLQNVCDVMDFIKKSDLAKKTNYVSLSNSDFQKMSEIHYLKLKKYSQIYINEMKNVTFNCEVPNLMYESNENIVFDCYKLFSGLCDIQEKEITKSAEKQYFNGKIWYCQICNTENNPHETLCMACEEERCLDSREFEMNENYEDNGCDETDNEQEMEQSTLDNCETSSVNYNEEERNDDCVNNNVWKCMSCNKDNWINNSVCVACGVNKDGKVDVPESHVMWRCTKCGIDNLLSNRTCVGCDAVDPNIDKWVCEQCSLVHGKCAVECSACGMKNNNFVKCSKASVFVRDGTVCQDCLRKVQNSEKYKNYKNKCRLCRKYPINSNSAVNYNLLCNKCLKKVQLCRNCGSELKLGSVMCLKCSLKKWICSYCEDINSHSQFTCGKCNRSRLKRYMVVNETSVLY